MTDAKALFERLRVDDGDDVLREANALEDRFDKAGNELLDAVFADIKTTILKEPEQKRKNTANYIYDDLRDSAALEGAAFACNEKNLQVWLNKLYRENRYQDNIRYTVFEVWEWVHHYGLEVASWWCAPREYKTKKGALAKYYRPDLWPDLGKYLNADGHGAMLGSKTERTLRRVRYYDTSKGVRTMDDWQAIAFILYNSVYFDADFNYQQWCKIFCDALSLPSFTSKPGHSETWRDRYNQFLIGDFKHLKQK